MLDPVLSLMIPREKSKLLYMNSMGAWGSYLVSMEISDVASCMERRFRVCGILTVVLRKTELELRQWILTEVWCDKSRPVLMSVFD